MEGEHSLPCRNNIQESVLGVYVCCSLYPSLGRVLDSFCIARIRYPDKSNLQEEGRLHGTIHRGRAVKAAGS